MGSGVNSSYSPRGAAGNGGFAECIIQSRRIERTNLTVQASAGGRGARGEENPNGNGSGGGDGGTGGDAIVRITGESTLDLLGCQIMAGSGDAGKVEVNVSAMLDLVMSGTVMSIEGGNGGWGGDYGRHGGGTGTQGTPTPGSDGGTAGLNMDCGGNMSLRRVSLSATGGDGMDGGAGYEKGESGGRGGSSMLRARTDKSIAAEDIALMANGGRGGNGGPAFSHIFGNGGAGGDAKLEFSGLMDMLVERFSMNIYIGKGGKGNNPTWDGAEGIPTFNLETVQLEMWDGVLDQPLDDLGDNAQGYLYNVSFPFTSLIPVLPIHNAQVWSWFPVDIRVVDNHITHSAHPLKDYEVRVSQTSTGATTVIGKTDANGFVSAYLQSFHYTSHEAEFIGEYLVTAISPDGRTAKTARMEVRGPLTRPNHVTFVLEYTRWLPTVFIEHPSQGQTYTISYQNPTLEVYGFVTDMDEFPPQCMTVRLYPVGDPAGDWPAISLNRSDILLSEVKDLKGRWGMYFPPEPNTNKWQFFFRYTILSGDVHLPSGEYIVNVTASDFYAAGWNDTRLSIIVRDNHPPDLALATDLDRVDWNSTAPLMLTGTSSDDHNVPRVEVRLDGGTWAVANGTSPWSFRLDLGSLAEGFHTIEVRASDGELVSPAIAHTFTIDRPDAPDGDGGGDHGPPPVVWASIAIVLAVIAILAVVLLQRRKRSDA
jgi:hypothetical protein